MRFAQTDLQAFGEPIFEIAVPAQLNLKTALVFRLMGELAARGYIEAGGDPATELVFDEALTNAMVHGNRLEPGRKIHVRLFGDSQRWGALIADEGPGFGPADLPQDDDPEALFRESGRGIRLMEANLDDLVYSPTGSAVLMIRRRQTPAAGTPAGTPAAAPDPAGAAVRATVLGRIGRVRVEAARITHDNLDAVRSALLQGARDYPAVILDLEAVGYVSSAFLGMLMAAFKAYQTAGRPLVLAALPSPLAAILASVALDRVLTIYPTVALAAADLEKKIGS